MLKKSRVSHKRIATIISDPQLKLNDNFLAPPNPSNAYKREADNSSSYSNSYREASSGDESESSGSLICEKSILDLFNNADSSVF